MKECLENVRKIGPLVHNITNYVTVNDVANIILACGGSPIMADDPKEVEEITSLCMGLNINIGTLNQHTIPSMAAAGKRANQLGHTVLLDPVGAGASRLRTETAENLLKEVRFDVIRGNVSEIKSLFYGSGRTKGVDADLSDSVTEENLAEAVRFIKDYAKDQESVIVMTGAIDLVADGKTCYVIRNGRPEMSRITGTGCQLSGMMSAFIAANPNQVLLAAAAATGMMGLSGELAWKNLLAGEGNASYRSRIIDAVYQMDGETLERGMNYEVR